MTLIRSGTNWWTKGRYLTGGIDQPLAGRFDGFGTGATNLALIGDRQGTTLVALRGDGTKEINANYYARDAYGGLLGVSGQAPEGSSYTETGYTGASTPNGTGGFAYLRNRWYDPKTGRFLTQDPIGMEGGVNLYSYAGSNPVSFFDPFGLECMRIPVTRTITRSDKEGIHVTVEASFVLVCFRDPPTRRALSTPLDMSGVTNTVRLIDPAGLQVIRRRADRDSRAGRLCRAAAHTVKMGAARAKFGLPLLPLEEAFFGRVPDAEPSGLWDFAREGVEQAAQALWLFERLNCPKVP